MRVTNDGFQQQTPPNDAYYQGRALRLKYGYLYYNYLTGSPTSFSAAPRFAMLQTW